MYWVLSIYSRPLSSTGLNCEGPLTRGLFSTVNTTVLHNPQLVESEDGTVNMEMGVYVATWMDVWGE